MVLIVLRHSRSLLRSKIDVLSAKCGLRNLDNISEMVSRFNTVICLKTMITIHGQPHPRQGCQTEKPICLVVHIYSNTVIHVLPMAMRSMSPLFEGHKRRTQL